MAGKKISLESVKKSQLLLPVTALILMLIVNVIVTPSFFTISIRNGVLYGYIIDILNRSCELIILAAGMTLVAASSRGTDISVGAVMAVSAAVCVRLLGSSYDAYAVPVAFAVFMCLFAGTMCGVFNGLLVAKLNIQPVSRMEDVLKHALVRLPDPIAWEAEPAAVPAADGGGRPTAH